MEIEKIYRRYKRFDLARSGCLVFLSSHLGLGPPIATRFVQEMRIARKKPLRHSSTETPYEITVKSYLNAC
jgi:hypothetical protein